MDVYINKVMGNTLKYFISVCKAVLIILLLFDTTVENHVIILVGRVL